MFAALILTNPVFWIGFGLGFWVCSIYMGRLRRRSHATTMQKIEQLRVDVQLPRQPGAPLVEPQTNQTQNSDLSRWEL